MEHVLERSVLLHQRHRRLLTDPRDARDVVARIALQRLEINDKWWFESVAFTDFLHVVDDRVADAAAAREDADVFGDQLQHVEVAGQDDDIEPCSLGLLRERADDIIGLVSRYLDDGDPERQDDFSCPRKLRTKLVRSAHALRFVLRDSLVAKGRAGEVEGRDRICRRGVVERFEEHGCEAVCGVGHLATAVAQRRHRVEGAIHKVVPVHQQQGLASHSGPW
jgi:hypothetical protein